VLNKAPPSTALQTHHDTVERANPAQKDRSEVHLLFLKMLFDMMMVEDSAP
jgi:hypothetical protein